MEDIFLWEVEEEIVAFDAAEGIPEAPPKLPGGARRLIGPPVGPVKPEELLRPSPNQALLSRARETLRLAWEKEWHPGPAAVLSRCLEALDGDGPIMTRLRAVLMLLASLYGQICAPETILAAGQVIAEIRSHNPMPVGPIVPLRHPKTGRWSRWPLQT
jgi:hypothetical protein